MSHAEKSLNTVVSVFLISMLTLVVACKDDGGGSGDPEGLPILALDCNSGAGAGEAVGCGTAAAIAEPAVTAWIKLATATCNGTAFGDPLARSVSTVECFLGLDNDCVGAIDAWTTADGNDPLKELAPGDYVLDIYIDVNNTSSRNNGDALSCTLFSVKEDEDTGTVTADTWSNYFAS